MVDWTHLKALVSEKPIDALKRRLPGFYERYAGKTDEYGFDLETWAKSEPPLRFLFEDYFGVTVNGLENVPNEGSVLLIGNHSGLLPIDAMLMSIALANSQSCPRRIRYLVTSWFFSLPLVGDWIRQTGGVRASLEAAEKLIKNHELVGLFPEGIRGVGKPLKDRYRVIDFHPGFVKLAIAAQVPIIPIATVGGDEIFPNFRNLPRLGRLVNLPFFPLTPGFPWLPFPLWLTPLPVKWYINVHKPIKLDYPPEKASDKKLVREIAKDIQYEIQRDLNDILEKRKTLFTGWDCK